MSQLSVLISREKKLSLDKPLVMGILNVTPDSFLDGGKFLDADRAVERALQMVAEGADIIDIGGESTGPDSVDVPVDEELRRVIPVIGAVKEAIKNEELRMRNVGQGSNNGGKGGRVWISVDTYKAEVAKQALEAGADMINDVTALRGDVALPQVLVSAGVPIIIMYSKDPSARTTRKEIQYDNVIKTIHRFFEERLDFGVAQGIARERFILDPGMGAFISSDPKYSLQILKRLRELEDLGLPLLVGPSRKSFIGQTLNLPLGERLEGTLASCAVAVMNGAAIVRVHDVKAARRTVDMVHAIKNGQ